MAIRSIYTEKDFSLFEESKEITNFDDSLEKLLCDLKDTLKNSGGIGIAAPQIGYLKRVAIIDLGDDTGTLELVNPEIIEKSGIQEDLEGCLSCPGQFGITRRPMNVTVAAQDRLGEKHIYKGSGLLARAFCHEIDHLDGIIFKDHVIRMLTEEEVEKLTSNDE